MANVTDRYGNFTDEPADEAWYLKFDVLSLPTDHRRILNRQPETVAFLIELVYIVFDNKVMSN